jgi:hypothetical protein
MIHQICTTIGNQCEIDGKQLLIPWGEREEAK